MLSLRRYTAADLVFQTYPIRVPSVEGNRYCQLTFCQIWENSVSSKPHRSYTNATLAALMTLARGGCYWPDCNVPIIRMIDGEPVLNLDIAHVRAFEEGGKRFDPTWSVKERNGFANLILLCTPHHKVIDGPRSNLYPTRVLLAWKIAREADGLDALEGLGDLSKADLGVMIADAQNEFLDRLGPALDEFAKTAPELASLLRTVINELTDPRVHGFGISEDALWALNDSAHALAHLQDSASMLADAANSLEHLGDSALMLKQAAIEVQSAANALSDARYGG
ncbi:hypothetical protein [Streptosporangium saharense]|uniref:HNH endonuclease n=1 Tax=Streptosporangium saharense TaxID=1706840 RepID=A0A7W7VKR0_9ACTN|nr:hypothetical protein [Streptosporangium saharense]MBB4913350.1 hypothetical protein [Streptosporangium saharense]